MVPEPIPGAQLIKEIAQADAIVLRQVGCLCVKARDVAQHRKEARVHQIAPLREQRIKAGQPVFQPSAAQRGAKAHVAGNCRNVELFKQGDKIGIVHAVIDDKAGIHRLIAALSRHDGARVASQPTLRLEQDNRIVCSQKMGGGHAGYAASYHRDAPRCSSKPFEWHEWIAPWIIVF